MTTPDSQRVVPVDMIRRWSAALDDALKSIGYWGESVSATEMAAIIAAAPAASPQEGVRVVAWRMLTSRGTVINGWIDGAPTDRDYAYAAEDGYTIELAYSHPPAQAQGAAKPAAWLHQVVGDDGEPDQALSFAPDNFPLQGVVGYRSLSHKPLYLHPAVISEPTDVALNVNHIDCHKAADAFWAYWQANGETHKHGYYESTWGAINAALRTVGVVPHEWVHAALDAAREG